MSDGPKAKFRPIRDRRKRMQAYKASRGSRCEGCDVKHGKLTEIEAGLVHRVELRIAFRNGNRNDYRWKNFALVCDSCAPRFTSTYNPSQRDPRALAAGEGN